jgi:hypothetical protein
VVLLPLLLRAGEQLLLWSLWVTPYQGCEGTVACAEVVATGCAAGFNGCCVDCSTIAQPASWGHVAVGVPSTCSHCGCCQCSCRPTAANPSCAWAGLLPAGGDSASNELEGVMVPPGVASELAPMWVNNPCVLSGSSSKLMDPDTSCVCDAAELGAKSWLPLPAEAPAPETASLAKLLPAAGVTPASMVGPVWPVRWICMAKSRPLTPSWAGQEVGCWGLLLVPGLH